MTPYYHYVICFNPPDYPHKYTVRRHLVGIGFSTPDKDLWAEPKDTLDEARATIPKGQYRIDRWDEDDPVIVESWI